ncbi:MAG: FAD-dependent oxidoreductase [Erythrobacter sp.]
MADPKDTAPYDLILLGGGHAHVAVLADWIKGGLPAERIALITPSPHLRYSGMVPGWIAGQFDVDEGRVDVRALSERAGVTFIEDRSVSMDSNMNSVLTGANGVVNFRYCSIDTGGVGRAAKLLGDDPRLVDVRPIEAFSQHMNCRDSAGAIVVIGGGAGGVELAFALRNRGRFIDGEPQDDDAFDCAKVTLITGTAGLLADFARGPREMVRGELEAQNIDVLECDVEGEGDGLRTHSLPETISNDPIQSAKIIVAALGSGAPDWPSSAGLDVDEDGFIAVDQFQRCTSHSHIFASGDVASRQDRTVPHSGVHAVHTGPALAKNLRKVLAGEEPQASYKPRPVSLYILSTANGEAVAVYGPVATKAEWASGLKAWIDKRWLRSYAKLLT